MLSSGHQGEATHNFFSYHRNISEVGRRLAVIGDEINAKYQKEFKLMSKSLNIRQGATDHLYEAFCDVCHR